MAAESDVDIDCGKSKFDDKFGLDMKYADVMLPLAETPVPAPEMTIGGDEGVSREDGEKDYDVVVNGGELERSSISDDDRGGYNETGRFNSSESSEVCDVKESEMVSGRWVASNQLVTDNGECEELEGKERESEIRVDDRDLVIENGVGTELNDAAEDDCEVSMKETDTVDALECGVNDEVVPCAVENSCQDPIDGGVSQTKTDLSNDTVNMIVSGVSEGIADLKIRNDCHDHIDNKESRMKMMIVNGMEVILNDVVVNFEIQNGSHNHTDVRESKKTEAIDGMESGDDDKCGESNVQNGCSYDFSSAESRIQAGLLDATESGFAHEAVDSVVKHNSCNNPRGAENGFKLGCIASLDVNYHDTELHNELKSGGGETATENGVCDYSGIETEAKDLSLIMEDTTANDLVNETDGECSQNVDMKTELCSEMKTGGGEIIIKNGVYDYSGSETKANDSGDEDTELHSEMKTGGGETIIENGVCNHSGSETKANVSGLIMEESLANDLVNESNAGYSQNMEMETGGGEIMIANGVCDHSGSETKVNDSGVEDTELLCEMKTGGGETVIENGVWDHSRSETKANDSGSIVEYCLANDLVNERGAGRSHNGEMSTIRPGVVEVEHKEFDVDSGNNGNSSAVDDGRPKFSLTDNNVSSFHSVISEDIYVSEMDNVVEEKNEVLVREIKPETVNNESKEFRQGNNGLCGKNEINFGTLKCYIPSSDIAESSNRNQKNGTDNIVHLVSDSSSKVVDLDSSSAGKILPSEIVASSNSEENANEILDCNSIQMCDEAEENNTDEVSMSSNVDALDSQIPETVKWPFCYLVRLPRYDDEKLREQIRLAEKELEVKTRKRDNVVVQYREKKSACMKSKKNLDAARSEENAVCDLVRTKRQEIDHAQTLMNRAKNAMTFEDATSKIFKMEHRIQHETLHLNEEKQLIRKIKQLKQIFEQHSSDRSKMMEDQQALDQKEQIEEQLKVLRKEMDTLQVELSRAEKVAKAAKKKYDDETAAVNESNSKLTAANDVRQAAYLDLINLKDQWKRKNSYFHSYMDDVKIAYAVAGDKEALERHCINQVEKFMELWNKDDELRRSYVRCNARSTLRRFRTSDGRSLVPNEEPLSLGIISDDRLNVSTKVESVASTSNLELNLTIETKVVNDESAQVVTEQKNQTLTTRRIRISTPPKKGLAEASWRNEVDEENKKRRQQEEGDLAKKSQDEEEAVKKADEESRRREEEAASLKEQKRLEEKVKAEEAKERNRRKAEKAQARAEFKARKEAEEKEKEREKKARKKEKKMALLAETIAESTESEHASHSKGPPLETTFKELQTKEASGIVPKRRRNPSQYAKHNKIISGVPPPLPLQKRNRKWMVKQLMWVLVMAAISLFLFIIGNYPNSWLYRFLSFGSGH